MQSTSSWPTGGHARTLKRASLRSSSLLASSARVLLPTLSWPPPLTSLLLLSPSSPPAPTLSPTLLSRISAPAPAPSPLHLDAQRLEYMSDEPRSSEPERHHILNDTHTIRQPDGTTQSVYSQSPGPWHGPLCPQPPALLSPFPARSPFLSHAPRPSAARAHQDGGLYG